MPGLAVLVRRDALDPERRLVWRARPHVAWVITADVIDLMASQKHVPEVGVKLDAGVLLAALDSDPAEPSVPDIAGLTAHLVEVPVGALRLKVLSGVLDAGV